MAYRSQPQDDRWLDSYFMENIAPNWEQEGPNHWTLDVFNTGDPERMVHAEIFTGEDRTCYFMVRFGDPDENKDGYYIHMVRITFGYQVFRRILDLLNISGTVE